MPKCDIDIVFAKPERQFAIGEDVQVRVIMTADEPVTCNALIFEVRWRTHGRGDVNHGAILTKSLFEGEFTQGEQTFEVSFPAPNGPLTYRGELINVDWEVLVRADIPWAIDPKFTADFVVHGLVEPDYYSGPVAPTRSGAVGMNRAVPIVLGLGMSLSISAAVLFMLASDTESEVEPAMIVGVLVVMFFMVLLVVSLVFGKKIRSALAERALGPVAIEAGTSYRVGDTVSIKLRFTPQRTVIMNSAHVVFTHHEWARWRAGTNTYSKEHVLISEHIELIPGVYPMGVPVEMLAEFVVPPGSAQTFGAMDNKVQWLANIEFDLKGSADWQSKLEFAVLPLLSGSSRSSEGAGAATSLVAAAAAVAPAGAAVALAQAAAVAGAATAAPDDRVSSTSSTGEVLVAGPKRIIDLVKELPTFGLLSNEQEARVVALQQVTFRLQFAIHEIDQTFTAERPELAGGQTVTGHLSDGVEIRVQLSPSYDDAVVEAGKTVFVIARVARWDAIARTMVLCEVTE